MSMSVTVAKSTILVKVAIGIASEIRVTERPVIFFVPFHGSNENKNPDHA